MKDERGERPLYERSPPAPVASTPRTAALAAGARVCKDRTVIAAEPDRQTESLPPIIRNSRAAPALAPRLEPSDVRWTPPPRHLARRRCLFRTRSERRRRVRREGRGNGHAAKPHRSAFRGRKIFTVRITPRKQRLSSTALPTRTRQGRRPRVVQTLTPPRAGETTPRMRAYGGRSCGRRVPARRTSGTPSDGG